MPGLQVCELMPGLAKRAHKYTVIRSVTTLNKPGDHGNGTLYWLTGNPRMLRGTDEYPMYGAVVSKLRPGPADLPTFAALGSAPSAASSFLGPAYAPFVFDPTESKNAINRMLTPQMELPAFERQADLLKAVDTRLRRLDGLDPLVEALDQYQQTAFNLLRSPKLRQATDLSREPVKSLERYARAKPATKLTYAGVTINPLHFLLARRLVEAGVPIVHFNFGYWDWHAANFTAGREQFPMLDACLSALLDDLDDRGLLESTIVLALGEMGREPLSNKGGRGHWDYAQFVLAAGGGFRSGTVIGATDKKAASVIDKFYKVESFGRTLYHLLGIDPDTIVRTPTNRPVKLIVEEAPIIKEAIL